MVARLQSTAPFPPLMEDFGALVEVMLNLVRDGGLFAPGVLDPSHLFQHLGYAAILVVVLLGLLTLGEIALFSVLLGFLLLTFRVRTRSTLVGLRLLRGFPPRRRREAPSRERGGGE